MRCLVAGLTFAAAVVLVAAGMCPHAAVYVGLHSNLFFSFTFSFFFFFFFRRPHDTFGFVLVAEDVLLLFVA